ncbi:MAG: hypothetical protein PUB60_10025 [Veillonellaceae bacterium]|nr:hypothetical protein [Veillonellaceae bacterium]
MSIWQTARIVRFKDDASLLSVKCSSACRNSASFRTTGPTLSGTTRCAGRPAFAAQAAAAMVWFERAPPPATMTSHPLSSASPK